MEQIRQHTLEHMAEIVGGQAHVSTAKPPVLRRRHHPEVARLPSFLARRPQGGWAKSEEPVRIRGFNLEEDVIAISLPRGEALTQLTFRHNPEKKIAVLGGNGKILARVFDAPAGLNLSHVRVACQAASL